MHKRVDVRRLGTVKGCGREGWSLWARGGVGTGVGLFGIRFFHTYTDAQIYIQAGTKHSHEHTAQTHITHRHAQHTQACTNHTDMHRTLRHSQNTQASARACEVRPNTHRLSDETGEILCVTQPHPALERRYCKAKEQDPGEPIFL